MPDSASCTGTVWRWSNGVNPASWHFLTIDGEAGETIAAFEAMRRLELGPNGGRRFGFGSVKVTARIGKSSWNTSVFPSKSEDGYLLPLKAAIRKAEGIVEGSQVSVSLTLL